MKIKNVMIMLILSLYTTFGFANCGPQPGGVVRLSANNSGNYYLTKKEVKSPFFIANDTSTTKSVRICVNSTTDWWTTILNNQCSDFLYPSGDIEIRQRYRNEVLYQHYSAGRCDAVISLKPMSILILKISRLAATSGTWQVVTNHP